jgi:hypothetical protein
MPLASVIAGIQNADGDVSFTLVFVSLLLPVFSIGAALWALSGDEAGRISLLAVVSLNFLWWLFLAVISIANSESSGEAPVNLVIFVLAAIRPVAFLICFWWYLTKSDVVAYFRQS